MEDVASKVDARREAVSFIARNGYAFLVLGLDGIWRAAERKPSLRAPGMKVVELTEDGRELLA